jgi:hypothetical protein
VTIRTAERPPYVVTHARVAGFLLLLTIPLAFSGSLSTRLIAPGDAEATANHILAAESLFRLGVVGTLALMVANAFLVVLVFYPLLKPVNTTLAVLMVVLNLLGVSVTLLNELSRFAILNVLNAADLSRAFTTNQIYALISQLLYVHDTGGLIAGFFWGLWLVPYALLVFQSRFLPRMLGVLLLIECLGFLIQSVGGLLLPNLDANLELLPAITSWAELFLPLWLLIKGIDVEQWKKRAFAA